MQAALFTEKPEQWSHKQQKPLNTSYHESIQVQLAGSATSVQRESIAELPALLASRKGLLCENEPCSDTGVQLPPLELSLSKVIHNAALLLTEETH